MVLLELFVIVIAVLLLRQPFLLFLLLLLSLWWLLLDMIFIAAGCIYDLKARILFKQGKSLVK